MPDPFEEKSQHFFPREPYFWVLNTLGWLFTLYLMNPGNALPGNPDNAQPGFQPLYLASVWLAYYLVGTLILLAFRRFYYRQRWYRRKFIGSWPLMILVACGGGMVMAVLVTLPMDLMRKSAFRIYNEAGMVVSDGAFSVTLFSATEHALLLLVWLLAYLGIEGAANARDLAFKALTLENSLKDARLNALAGQINPHFLFNALNNIRFMIRQDAEGAEESLVDLSAILRHSLEASQQEKVLLAQELLIVERYLSLMKNHMQRRLDYSIQSADVSQNVLVPPMIVQMLAENAIKHGVEQIREGGRVDIHCSMTASQLCVEVRNSALPTNSDMSIPEVPLSSGDADDKGLGLSNIRKRLRLLYGDAAQLSMFRQDSVFVVRIVLPAEEAA